MDKKPIVAILYDFDNTLSTRDMQEYSFIPDLGMTPYEFWTHTDQLAHEQNMDHILAMLMAVAQDAKKHGIVLTREKLVEYGRDVEFHKGVKSWFDRVNAYGEALGFEVRHYVISSGILPMIEGCSIADKFYKIYAGEYVYGEDGTPVWPAMSINYTNKTQFLYRINKGVEDISEDNRLNQHLPYDEKPIPFAHMIYVGDGSTDVPAMKIMRKNGGYAIGVTTDLSLPHQLSHEDRVDFFVNADYSEGSKMDEAIKVILNKIKALNDFTAVSTSIANKKVK